MPPAVHNLLSSAIPLPVVVVLVLHASALTWFVASSFQRLDARVSALELADKPMMNHEARIIVLEQRDARVFDELTEIKMMLRERKSSLDLPNAKP
jgi:hypothetical protein